MPVASFSLVTIASKIDDDSFFKARNRSNSGSKPSLMYPPSLVRAGASFAIAVSSKVVSSEKSVMLSLISFKILELTENSETSAYKKGYTAIENLKD